MTAAVLERLDFIGPDELAGRLADRVAADLRAEISARGVASLALSGGSTPRRFLACLADQALDWERVTVTLVDERWVAPSSERSNERMIRETLLRGAAAKARLVGLYRPDATPEEGAARIAGMLGGGIPFPFAATVLGMGVDGHTASLFPGGDRLAEALDPDNATPLIAMRAAGAGEPRITFTLSALLRGRSLYLHIEGEEKAAVLAQALVGGPAADMPVRAVLRQTKLPVTIAWCP